MNDETAIHISHLSKCYRIYDRPHNRLKQAIASKANKIIPRPLRVTAQYFREFWALRDIVLTVAKGETVGVIGRNGSGKSTLLQLICGTVAPTRGDIEVNGRVAALLELGAGFNPEFTGRENVYMNASILGLSKEQIDARYNDIVAFADIGEFIDQPVKTYSSGMFVRLAFAVIAHVDADILIIDEALAVGDAFFTQKCMRFLRQFKKEGTVLFVSHDTPAVINLCQRAVWLDRGQVRMIGEAKEVCEAYHQSIYELQNSQGAKEAPTKERETLSAKPPKPSPLLDIEQFVFGPDEASFGAGGAAISKVQLLDAKGEPLNRLAEAGETVIIAVQCQAHKEIASPIIGFFVKDRLGQILFGENTFKSYMMKPLHFNAGEVFTARFEFGMPLLPTGDYSICAAIAEGTQLDHVQHHWIHDALIFRINSSTVHCGLIGIPMDSIDLSLEFGAVLP
ncbi:ABC transporter ATP-binding protein [Methylomagnum sp.]